MDTDQNKTDSQSFNVPINKPEAPMEKPTGAQGVGTGPAIVSGAFDVPIEARNIESSDMNFDKNDEPMPVVKVLSVRGVEYLFMSIFLWISAGSFIGLILSLLNGGTGFSALAFPLSMLLVSLPGFAFLFLRLKRAELEEPRLRFDPSKRRLSQTTQVLAFLTCLINIITFVYLILQKIGGEGELAIGKTIINMLVILLVAGGVLVYYWNDEHKRVR